MNIQQYVKSLTLYIDFLENKLHYFESDTIKYENILVEIEGLKMEKRAICNLKEWQ